MISIILQIISNIYHNKCSSVIVNQRNLADINQLSISIIQPQNNYKSTVNLHGHSLIVNKNVIVCCLAGDFPSNYPSRVGEVGAPVRTAAPPTSTHSGDLPRHRPTFGAWHLDCLMSTNYVWLFSIGIIYSEQIQSLDIDILNYRYRSNIIQLSQKLAPVCFSPMVN